MWDNPNNLLLTHQALDPNSNNPFLPWMVEPRLVGKPGALIPVLGGLGSLLTQKLTQEVRLSLTLIN
jgi:hypothetical protein